MRVVISQPMYLPWRGLFEQINRSDIFVYYDDVQLPKGGGKGRGFITRVQIKTENGWKWLSVPVVRADQGYQSIKDTRLLHQSWRKSHLDAIHGAYANAPYYEMIREELLNPIYAFPTDFLCEFSIHAIRICCDYLGLHPEFHLSSELHIPKTDNASRRVLDICLHFNATEYISGLGGLRYLDHDLFDKQHIQVKYMQYDNTPYNQSHGEFNPYVSVVDLLCCHGRESSSYLTSNAVSWQLVGAASSASGDASAAPTGML